MPKKQTLEPDGRGGRTVALCPSDLDINLFGDGQGVINIDTEVADGALDLRVSEKQLHRAQITCFPVDERCFRPSQRMGAKFGRIEPNTANPVRDQAGILPSTQMAIITLATGE